MSENKKLMEKKLIQESVSTPQNCSPLSIISEKNSQLADILIQAEKYLHGIEVHQDERRACELLEYAAKQGHTQAMFKLGELYEYGQGNLGINYNRALEWYESAAKQGHRAALYSLIRLLYSGGLTGSALDHKRAAELIKAHAALEDGPILLRLATLYARGFSVQQDMKKASELAKRAEVFEDAEHLFEMAGIYTFNFRQPPEKIFELYQKSAKLGNKYAQLMVADAYRFGQGVNRDSREALKWYQRSVEQGNSSAVYTLINLVRFDELIKEQEEFILNLFKKAAALGNAAAQFYLGFLYQHGVFTLKDEKLGNEWIEKSIQTANKQKDDYDLILIADHIAQKIPVDEKRLTELYRMIAERNSINAIEYAKRLGEFYLLGKGVEQNKKIGLFWLHRAIKLSYQLNYFNNNHTLVTLANKFFLGEDIEKNEKLAAEIYERLLENEAISPSTLLKLSMIYAEGEAVVQDDKRANEYLEKSARLYLSEISETRNFLKELNEIAQLCISNPIFKNFNNKKLLIDIYETLSEKYNDLYSEYHLALLYLEDNQIPKAIEFAIKACAHKNSDQHCLEAHYLLGTIFFEGKYVAHDESEAFKWFSFSAEEGHIQSQIKLATLYENSPGLMQDINQAVLWYCHALYSYNPSKNASDLAKELTLSNEIAYVAKKLIRILQKRPYALEFASPKKDEYFINTTKNKIYSTAAKAGLPEAMCRLAESSHKIGRDIHAIAWLQRASSLGSSDAKCALAEHYLKSDPGEHEFAKEAVQLYREAIQQGSARAEFFLGKMYAEGYLIFPQDKKMAFELLERAIQKAETQLDSNLLFLMGCLYRTTSFIFYNETRALHLFQLSAELGCAAAQFQLGFLLKSDKKLKKEQEAEHWLQRAAEQNFVIDNSVTNPWPTNTSFSTYAPPSYPPTVFWAIDYGISSCFPLLIEKNVPLAFLRYREPGAHHTPLTFAMSTRNNIAIVKFILESNYVESNNIFLMCNANSDFTPLHYAAMYDFLNIFIPRLIKKCGDISRKQRNRDGHTPLQLAINQNKHEARILLTLKTLTPFFLEEKYLQLILNCIEFSYVEKTRDHLLLNFENSVLSNTTHEAHQKITQAFDLLCKKNKQALESIQKQMTWSSPQNIQQWIQKLFMSELQVYYFCPRQTEVFFRSYIDLLLFKDKYARDVLPNQLPREIGFLVLQYYDKTFNTESFVEDVSSEFSSGKASFQERSLIKGRVNFVLTYFNQKQNTLKYQPSKHSPLLSLMTT